MNSEIRRAVAADAGAIGALYSRAFADDPVTSWVTPDLVRRTRLLRRLNSEIARYAIGTQGVVYVAESAGALVGAAIWMPPTPQSPMPRISSASLQTIRSTSSGDSPRLPNAFSMSSGRSMDR